MSRSQYFFENDFFAFYIQPGQILVNRFFQMFILAVLRENTVQCPKTEFLCLVYIYTFQIASFFKFFFQLTYLGSKNPLQLAHSGVGLIKSKIHEIQEHDLCKLNQTCKTIYYTAFFVCEFYLFFFLFLQGLV